MFIIKGIFLFKRRFLLKKNPPGERKYETQ